MTLDDLAKLAGIPTVAEAIAERELALKSDMELLRRLSSTKYAGTAKLLQWSWQKFTGREVNLLRAWVIRAILRAEPGPCPWPDISNR